MFKTIEDIMYMTDGNNPFREGLLYGRGGLGYKPTPYNMVGGGMDKNGNPLFYSKNTLEQKNIDDLENIFLDNLEQLETEHLAYNKELDKLVPIEIPEDIKNKFIEENKFIQEIKNDKITKNIEKIDNKINRDMKNIDEKRQNIEEQQEDIYKTKEYVDEKIKDGILTPNEAQEIINYYKHFNFDKIKDKVDELIEDKTEIKDKLLNRQFRKKNLFNEDKLQNLSLSELKHLEKTSGKEARKKERRIEKIGEAPFIEYQKEYEETKNLIKEAIEQNDIDTKINEDEKIKDNYDKINDYNPIVKYDFNDNFVKSKEYFDNNVDFEKLQDNYEMIMSLIKTIDDELFDKFIISFNKGFEPKIIENLNTKEIYDNAKQGENAYIDGMVKIQYMNSKGKNEDIWVGIEYKFYGSDKTAKYVNNPEYIYQDIINNNEEDFEIYNKFTIDNLITIDKEIFVLRDDYETGIIDKYKYKQELSILKNNRNDIISSMNDKEDYLNGFLNMCELSTINVKASKFSIKEDELTIKPNSRGRDKEYEYLRKVYKDFKERPIINQSGLIEKIVDRNGNEIDAYNKQGFKNAKNYTIVGLQDFVVGMNMSKAVKDGILNNNDPLMSFKLNKSAYKDFLGDHIGLYSWLFKPFKIQSNKKKLFKK